MKLLAPPEHYEKMAQVQSLSAAIQRAKEALAKDKSYGSASNLQRLIRQRDELRGTMPPLRAVS
jgi:hypothetical protein